MEGAPHGHRLVQIRGASMGERVIGWARGALRSPKSALFEHCLTLATSYVL